MKCCRVCGDMHYAKGFCLKHWERWRRYGDPLGGYAGAREKVAWRKDQIGVGITRCPDDPDG